MLMVVLTGGCLPEAGGERDSKDWGRNSKDWGRGSSDWGRESKDC